MAEIEKGTVVRYCKPSTLDEQGKPMGSSFQLRIRTPTEKYLSVHLLDYFDKPSEIEKASAVKVAMQKQRFNFKENGVFSTLDIKQSQDYINQLISEIISYKSLNLPHCGIFHEHDDLVISELLSQCVLNNYPINQL